VCGDLGGWGGEKVSKEESFVKTTGLLFTLLCSFIFPKVFSIDTHSETSNPDPSLENSAIQLLFLFYFFIHLFTCAYIGRYRNR
jgi:hypothetical protein